MAGTTRARLGPLPGRRAGDRAGGGCLVHCGTGSALRRDSGWVRTRADSKPSRLSRAAIDSGCRPTAPSSSTRASSRGNSSGSRRPGSGAYETADGAAPAQCRVTSTSSLAPLAAMVISSRTMGHPKLVRQRGLPRERDVRYLFVLSGARCLRPRRNPTDAGLTLDGDAR